MEKQQMQQLCDEWRIYRREQLEAAGVATFLQVKKHLIWIIFCTIAVLKVLSLYSAGSNLVVLILGATLGLCIPAILCLASYQTRFFPLVCGLLAVSYLYDLLNGFALLNSAFLLYARTESLYLLLPVGVYALEILLTCFLVGCLVWVLLPTNRALDATQAVLQKELMAECKERQKNWR